MKKVSLFLLLTLMFWWSCPEVSEPEDCAGVAGGNTICGCTDSIAPNFDPEATYDDGSCENDYTDNIFCDNMVLQRDVTGRIYGTADEGEVITVTIDGAESSATTVDGEWTVEMPPHTAGGPYTMQVQGNNRETIHNIMYGDVWLCGGQSNMEYQLLKIMNRGQYSDRLAEVRALSNVRMLIIKHVAFTELQDTIQIYTETDTTVHWFLNGEDGYDKFSAVGYVFGTELNDLYDVPIGLISADRGASKVEAWMSPEALEAAGKSYGKTWYKGMIAPIQRFPIKGVIWYQGEANAKSVNSATRYANTFKIHIQYWRDEWGYGDLPFLFVQLAGFGKGGYIDITWPVLRESQNKALDLPNTATALAIDLGGNGIHPWQKAGVADRLVVAARSMVYGEDIVHSGPVYNGMTINGNEIILTFDHIGNGLIARAGNPEGAVEIADELTGFTVCGPDEIFVSAQAAISGNTVIVSSPSVTEPVAVRYGWTGLPSANLYNTVDILTRTGEPFIEALPASPFRTDTFTIQEYTEDDPN